MTGEHAVVDTPEFDESEEPTTHIILKLLQQVKSEVSALREKVVELVKDMHAANGSINLLVTEYKGHNVSIAALTEMCAKRSQLCPVLKLVREEDGE